MPPDTGNPASRWDLFISHASEDKEELVRPLATALAEAGLRVWFDEQTLTLGDSLRAKIDDGLANSRFGLVVLSPAFFQKQWPQEESDGLIARESGSGKVILPIWHNLSAQDIRERSPLLASRLAVTTARGVPHVVQEILRVVANDPSSRQSMRAAPLAAGTTPIASPSVLWRSINKLILSRQDVLVAKALRLLVVDDHQLIAYSVGRYLSNLGHSVVTALSGDEALEQFRPDRFDCISTDLRMPGMTGLELLAEIQQQERNIPCIIFSAYDIDVIGGADCHDLFLQKAAGLDSLARSIQELCQGALRRIIFQNLPSPRDAYRSLYRIREQVRLLLDACSSTDLFETALRHELKGYVHACTSELAMGRPLPQATATLQRQAAKFEKLISQIRLGRSAGLAGYLDAIRADLVEECPEINFSFRVSDLFATLRGDLETLFLLTAGELIANARDAVDERGTISVTCRTRASERSAVLKVTNSGHIPAFLGQRILDEGVSTKGEGRGMGLSIVDRMTRQFDGTVSMREQNDTVEISVAVPLRDTP